MAIDVRRKLSAAVLLLSIGLPQSSCFKKAKVQEPEPEMTVVLPEEPEPSPVLDLEPPILPPPPAEPPPPPPAAAPPAPTLDAADRDFESGHYPAAARAYRNYLGAKGAAKDRDKALFRLAISQALTAGSPRSRARAESTLESVVSQYPKSHYAAVARLYLELLRETRRLRTENSTKDETLKRLQEDLERLKKIDLDRRITPEF